MPIPPRSPYRLLIIAGVAVVVASLGSTLTAAADRSLHAVYARTLIGRSSTQAVVLVGLDEDTRAAWRGRDVNAELVTLAAAIDAGYPRLVIWPERQLGALGLDGSQVLPAGDPNYLEKNEELAEVARASALGVDPLRGPILLRAQSPDFPAAALRSLGLPPRSQPLPARYVTGLPSLPAHRVAAGEIPAGTFRDRIVFIGRNDPMAATIDTPLGRMSPVEVEAHALLGVVDGASWVPVPAWLRVVMLSLWALALARIMRGGRPWAIVALTLLACMLVLAFDAALFDLGLRSLGASAGVVVAVIVGAGRLVGRVARTVAPAGLLARTDDAFASTTSMTMTSGTAGSGTLGTLGVSGITPPGPLLCSDVTSATSATSATSGMHKVSQA